MSLKTWEEAIGTVEGMSTTQSGVTIQINGECIQFPDVNKDQLDLTLGDRVAILRTPAGYETSSG